MMLKYANTLPCRRKHEANANFTGRYVLKALPPQQDVQRVRQAQEADLREGLQGLQPANVWGIPLATFSAYIRMEETLCRWALRIAQLQPPITLQIVNYGGIPDDCIYLRVQNQACLQQMLAAFRKLDGYLTGYDLPPMTGSNRFCWPLYYCNHPVHYNAAMRWYASREWYAEIAISQLAISRQEVGGFKTIQTFSLGSSMTHWVF